MHTGVSGIWWKSYIIGALSHTVSRCGELLIEIIDVLTVASRYNSKHINITNILTFIIHYGLAFEFNILMSCLYTNLSICCSLMTGFLFFQGHHSTLK